MSINEYKEYYVQKHKDIKNLNKYQKIYQFGAFYIPSTYLVLRLFAGVGTASHEASAARSVNRVCLTCVASLASECPMATISADYDNVRA